MNTTAQLWLVIGVTAAGTYFYRVSGAIPGLARHLRSSGWLRHVPPAVLLVLALNAVIPRSTPSLASAGALGSGIATAILASLLRMPLLLRLLISCLAYALVLMARPGGG